MSRTKKVGGSRSVLHVHCRHPPSPSFVQGQYIKSVFEGGPAELAGMLSGDHVLEVDGTDVTTMSHMKVCPHSLVYIYIYFCGVRVSSYMYLVPQRNKHTPSISVLLRRICS